jgi:signal transduction histidine kinase
MHSVTSPASAEPATPLAPDQHTRQYAELAELAGGFIHEIRNHLGTLGLNLELLAEDFAEPENRRERRALDRVRRLQEECRRLVEVSNDFLRFARVKELRREPTQLHGLVEEMIDFVGPAAREANVEVRSFVPADLPALSLDRELFKQALLNLLLNAEQAMPPEGGEVTLQAHAGTGTVVLHVIDTGCGMTPEQAARAFEPFHTTKPGGNGLGLPTVRRIVEAHGGRVDVESEPGRGTRFTLRLPAAE